MNCAKWKQGSTPIRRRPLAGHHATSKTGVVGRILAAAGAVAVVVGLMPAIGAISNAGVGTTSSGGSSRTLDHVKLVNSSLTWAQQFSPPTFADASCFDAQDCQIVGSSGGNPAVYATANQGWTWTPSTFAAPPGSGSLQGVSCISDTSCWAVGVAGGLPTAFALSVTSSGQQWTGTTLGTSSGTMYSISCVVVSGTNKCWAAGTLSTGGLIVYKMSGTSWGSSSESVTTSGTLTNPAISCESNSNGGTCLVVTGANAVATKNGGTGWTATSLSGFTSPSLGGVSCPSASVCFATNKGTGLIELSGGANYLAAGESWSALSLGVTVSSLSGIFCVSASVCTTGGLQVATDTRHTTNLGYQGTVLTTSNGGTSWTSSLTNGGPPTNLLPNALLVDGPSFFSCATTTVCVAGGAEGIVSSQDDNVSAWTAAFLTPVMANAQVLNCVSLLACYLSPSSDVSYRSSGGGLGWSPESLPTIETNVSGTNGLSGPTNAVSDSACSGTAICAILGTTTDGSSDEGWSTDGQTWATQANTDVSGHTYTALSCLTIGYCIYFDNASSSTTLDVTGPCAPSTSCPSLGALPSIKIAYGSSCVANDCWVVGQNTSSAGAVWATTNAGTSWTQETLSSPLNGSGAFGQSSISCSDIQDCVVANKAGAFAVTSNGGTTWSTLTAPTNIPSSVIGENSLSCPDADDCVAVVTTTGPTTQILALTDTAGVWSSNLSALPSSYTSASSVTCADASDCWVLAGNGTVNEAVLSTNKQDGPLDGPLTQGEEFAGNMAESKGQSPQAWAGAVNTADGDYSDSVPVVSIPARGLPFGLSLTYDAQLAQYQVASGATSPGPYGWGWTASNDLSITVGPGTNQVTVHQEGGAQVVYNETAGPTYTAVEPNRVLASLSFSAGDYTFEPNGGLQQYEFSASGPTAAGTLVAEKDANGNATTFGTETKGTGQCPNTTGVANCSTITDPAGRVITVVNATTTGLVSQVIDPATDTWLLGYDTHGNLTTVEDPKTNTTTFGYDTANANTNLIHDMTKITPPRNVGNALIAYDPLGRVYCQVAPAEYAAGVTSCPSYGSAWSTGLTLYQYSGSNSSYMGGTTTITDPHHNMTNHYYADGTLVATTSGVGTATPATVSIERDPATLLGAKVTDPDGNTTTTTYDARGNALTVTDPLGNTTTTSYNSAFNEPLVATDPKGITTTYTYDADGNELTKTVSALGTETGPPGWVKATADSGIKIQGISCPLITLCVGVDHSGHVEWSTNPMGATPAWSTDGVSVSAYALSGISCPTVGLCVAVGVSGQIVVSGSPTGGHTLWSAATADGTTAINAVSCPSLTFCVATDAAGYVLTASSPSGGASAWTKTHIDGTTSITAVSCATTSLCVATDANGNVLTTTNPTGGASAWTTTDIDGSANLTSATCPSTSLCAVTDVSGDVLTATNPTGGSGSWTKTDIDGSSALDAVSCASVTLCVATDGSGNVLAATSPTGTAMAWTKTDIDSSIGLPAASCPTAALCIVGDGSGSVLASTDPTGLPPWSKTTPDTAAILGLSCPSASLCVGVDHAGDVLWSATPSSGGWSTPLNVDSQVLNSISCPSTGLCVAVGATGQIVKSTNPIGGSWSSTTADGTTAVNGVSCPSTSLCVASDANGDILYNTSPATSATWTKTDIDGTADITDVSCASATQCVATSSTGYVITTTNPTGAASAWTITSIDTPNDVTSVDCPSTSLCVATDANGDVITATTPTGGSGSWTKSDIDGSTTIDAVNCASPSLCAVTDGAGTVLTATNPSGGVWGQDDIDGSATLEAVGCPTTNECMATDGSGAVLATTEARGFLSSTTTYTYGGSHAGDVMAVTDPDGHVTSFTYDTDGDVATTTVTAGSQVDTTTDKYDSLGQKFCEVGPDANAASVICAAQGSYSADTTTSAYDADGNVTSVTDPDGHTTSYSYDADNNKTLTTDALSKETETTYDADDRTATVVSGYGSTATTTTTTYTYDILSASCPTPLPAGTTYCTQVQNGLGAGHTTTNYFNALDQMIETAAPNTTAQTPTAYTYDPAGNTLTIIDGSGTTTHTYDSDNRVTGITYSNTATGYVQPHAVTYQYDADGNRTQMTDGTGTTSYTYDPLNRLQSVTNGASNRVTYAYDPVGNDTCLSYPNSGSTTCQTALSGTGLVAYGFDAANRTVTMADWVNPAAPTVFSYDNDSNLTGTTLPTTTPDTVTNGYDDTDALTSVSGVSTLTRNADESIATTTPAGGSLDMYGYDPLNRVTTGTTPYDPSGTTTVYTYDAASEISTATPSGGSTTDYEYNTDGQLCWTATTTGSCPSPPSGSNTYTYSTAGERTLETFSTGGSTIYQWDQAGDLTCITPSGTSCASPNLSETNTFAYNGDGLRMSDYLPASETTQQFTWDVSGSVPRLLECGGEYFFYGPNVGSAPIEQINISSGARNFLVSDPTGVREGINSSGTVFGTMSYDSYGNPCISCTPFSVFGFEGSYTDQTGLIYLINRYYDPTTGQFLSVDPDVDSTGQPYAFVADDPVNGEDSNGLFESGPGGQRCVGATSCNSRAVPINGCGNQCAEPSGSHSAPGDPTESGCEGPGPVTQAQMDAGRCLDYGITGNPPAGTDSGTAQWNNAATTFLTIFGLPWGATDDGVGAAASTGRTEAENLTEQLAMQSAKADPAAGRVLPIVMSDPNWPASEGWVKMEQNISGVEIHYVYNTGTGETADFKFVP